jgi:hypothetical protein
MHRITCVISWSISLCINHKFCTELGPEGQADSTALSPTDQKAQAGAAMAKRAMAGRLSEDRNAPGGRAAFLEAVMSVLERI